MAPQKEIVATQDTPRPFIPCWPSVGLYVDKRALDVNSEPEKRKAMTCNDIPKYSRRARGVKVRLHKFESLEVFFGTPHSYCSIPMFPMYPRHSKIRSRGFVVQLIGSSGRTIAKSARLQRRMSFHRSGGLAMGQKWWIYSKRLPIVRMAT